MSGPVLYIVQAVQSTLWHTVETTVRTERLSWTGTLLSTALLYPTSSETCQDSRGGREWARFGKDKKGVDTGKGDVRTFGIPNRWRTKALDTQCAVEEGRGRGGELRLIDGLERKEGRLDSVRARVENGEGSETEKQICYGARRV